MVLWGGSGPKFYICVYWQTYKFKMLPRLKKYNIRYTKYSGKNVEKALLLFGSVQGQWSIYRSVLNTT